MSAAQQLSSHPRGRAMDLFTDLAILQVPDLRYAISQRRWYWLAGCRFVITIIPGRTPGLVRPTEIATSIEVVHCANVLGEEKIQRPVKCYPDLLIKTRQFAQVNRPPHPPGEEAREIETKNPRHTHPATD
jgi:hypothetical protein